MMETTRGNAFAVDAQGEAVLLSSRGQQVMMQWERQYMERCVDALRVEPRDAVLEIGFGLAFSASRIQTFRPARHTVIECDAAVLQRARAFAAQHEGVEIVAGTWQRALPTLGAFDCVFFDDYPLPELEKKAVDGLSAQETSARRSRWHDFLDVVLHHVRPGARITGYLARPLDLDREGCVVEMARMPVEASPSCAYYPHDEAYIPVITVVDPAVARSSTRHLQRERLTHVRERLEVQQFLSDLPTELEELSGSHEELSSPHEDLPRSPIETADRSLSTTDTVAPAAHIDAQEASAYAGFASRSAYLASLRARRARTPNRT